MRIFDHKDNEKKNVSFVTLRAIRIELSILIKSVHLFDLHNPI